MAESPSSSSHPLDSNPNQPESDKPSSTPQPDQLPPPPPLLQQQQAPATSPFPSFPSYAPSPMTSVAGAPSFRPAQPQFSAVPNYLSHGVQPPGVGGAVQVMMNGGGAPGTAVAMAPPQMMQYQVAPGQPHNPAMRHYAPMPNGYAHVPQGAMNHPVS